MRILVISLYQVQEQFLCAHHRQEEPKSSGAGCVGWWLQNLIFPLHLVFRSIYSAWFLLYNPMLSPCSSMCVCVCVRVCTPPLQNLNPVSLLTNHVQLQPHQHSWLSVTHQLVHRKTYTHCNCTRQRFFRERFDRRV